MAGCAPGARPATPSRERRRERDPRRPCGEAGAPCPLRFGADESGASIDRHTRRLIGAPRVPPPPRCALRPRAPPARLRPRASAARDCECPQPSQVEGRAHEIPFPANLRHAAEGEATKAHRPLDLRVPAKDVPYAGGPNSAAGRRGRRRSAYEAPRAAADRGTPLGGAESKRRRRPRLPAPPSRVTLLGRRYAPRPQPAQVRSHSSRTFVTPRIMKRRKPIACLPP